MSIINKHETILFVQVPSTTFYGFDTLHHPGSDDETAANDVCGRSSHSRSVKVAVLRTELPDPPVCWTLLNCEDTCSLPLLWGTLKLRKGHLVPYAAGFEF